MPCFLSFFPPLVRTRTETPSDSTGPASASAHSRVPGRAHVIALASVCAYALLC